MKTPRELILERHQSAEARLQTIRAEDLAAEAGGRRRPSVNLTALAHSFWLETIWPWRRIWIGVGAAWVLILGVNLAASDPPSTAAAKPSPPNTEALAVLRQQEQLLSQLLGSDAPPPPAPPKTTGPRSATEPAPATGREASGRPGLRTDDSALA